jgi:hypothetical protein
MSETRSQCNVNAKGAYRTRHVVKRSQPWKLISKPSLCIRLRLRSPVVFTRPYQRYADA